MLMPVASCDIDIDTSANMWHQCQYHCHQGILVLFPVVLHDQNNDVPIHFEVVAGFIRIAQVYVFVCVSQ